MPYFRNIDIMFFTIFYILILVVTYFNLPAWACFIFLVGIFFGHIVYRKNNSLFYPFIIYPFMFMIRATDPDGVLLTILPDVITIVAVIIYISQFIIKRITIR